MEASISNPNEAVYRRNFIFFLLDGILFSVAMLILSPTTVLPDFIRSLTDSEVLIAYSNTLFEIGFTLPQLFIARYIVGSPYKKWWFIGPNIPVRFVILIFALLTVWLGAGQITLILIAFYICYGIASFGDGLVGVPWFDLISSSLDEKWRARMLGLQSAISNIIVIAMIQLGVIAYILSNLSFPNNYAILFGVAGILFVISILPVIFVRELPSGKAVEKLPAMSEFLPSLGLVLKNDKPFRDFVIVRILIIFFGMASAFYIGFGTERLGLSSELAVPEFLKIQTVGVICGSLIFAWLGAKSNLLYLRLSILGATFVPIFALLAGSYGVWLLSVAYFLLGLFTGNLFFTLQNWLIGYASHEQRPIYIGLGSTIAATVSVISPIIGGTIVENFGYEAIFMVAVVMILLALLMTLRYFPDPQDPRKKKREEELVEA
jgi:MFS family permease